MDMKLINVIPAVNMAGGQDRIFSYAVPENLKDDIKPGMVVGVPFGKKEILGVVDSVTDAQKPAFTPRPISKIVWRLPIVTPQLLALAKFLSEYYVAPLGLLIKSVIAKHAPRARLDIKNSEQTQKSNQKIVLTPEQKQAADSILAKKNQTATFLLYGVTGSGKTEVYLDVIEKLIREGKQALILVPEIILTPQTLARFVTRFGEAIVAVTHSKISYGQKSLLWEKIYNNEVKILIGPRSALFAPFKNLGLIVIDEEHDSSHKQYDQKPRLHVRTACQKLSEIWKCPLILGDATPQVETFFAASNEINPKLTGKFLYTKLSLASRYHQELPSVELVDMRNESKEGNFSIFSRLLAEKIQSTLARDQQVILLLNRRGMANSLTCKDCGNSIACQRCEVPVVFHSIIKRLVCHHCGRQYDIPAACPKCKSHRMRFSGSGTERVESEINEIYGALKIKRVDRDSLAKKSDVETLYRDLKAKRFQILVGTQLLAKGWDLSSVGLIGVMNADTTLSLPDFRSNERTFQLITQVMGRAGRGDFRGEAVLQTYNPENFAIGAAVKHDYQKFFDREILDRKEFGYPPFSRLVKLTLTHSSREKALDLAEPVARRLRSLFSETPENVIGPAPAFIPKIKGRYVIHVIIKAPTTGPTNPLPREVREVLSKLGPAWTIDVDPDSLL
ncbi:MAG: primosomal protein N' [Patescibacteria group bacterium]